MTQSEKLLIDERQKAMNQLTLWNLHKADNEFSIGVIDDGTDHDLFIYPKKREYIMPYELEEMTKTIEEASDILMSNPSIQVYAQQALPKYPFGKITITPCIKVSLWINHLTYKERYGTDI